jgi:3-hydroxybutyryl-CoA dehydratase
MTFFEHEFQFSKQDIFKFAELSGDSNPIHVDEDFAKTTLFGKNILHGFLGASVISKVLGVDCPGKGTIYLKQSLSFRAPMFPDIKYKVVVRLIESNKDKFTLLFDTSVLDASTGEICILGEALVKNDLWFLVNQIN